MAREVLITTPENIALEYELAGLGTRFTANIVDTFLQLLAIVGVSLLGILLFMLVIWAADRAGWAGVANFFRHLRTFATAALIIVTFIIFWGYHIYYELKWNGQTPGKRQLGLRVIREGGYPINGYGAAMRNLLRVVDFLPLFYSVGIFSILLSANYQRIGDLVGGALVVKQRAPQSLAGLLRVAQILPEHLDPAALAIIGRHAYELTPDEYRAVRHFTDRRRQLEWNAQQLSAIKIAVPLMERLRIVPPTDAREVDYANLLEYLAVAYEQARRPK
ncbi:MAG TPA: RDD family protein [Capsulimonadaceae bacterium]|nr:RDD family protein [Capsulimonadaceae bacterium]